MSIIPDDKDWTFVLAGPCPECGLDTRTLARASFAARAAELGAIWAALLRQTPVAALRARPRADRWSALEYGAHVRDVCRRMEGRVALLLAEDDPVFANWDQDATAAEERYNEQDPARVADELIAAATAIAERFGAVTPVQWARPGRRSNGSLFTVESLGRYFLHDVVHHLHDVGTPLPASWAAALPATP